MEPESAPETNGSGRLLTVPEVAAALRVDENTVRRWLRRGRLSGVNLGHRIGYRVRQSELDRFLDALSTGQRTSGNQSRSG